MRKNFYLPSLLRRDVNNFTSNIGIRFRRLINRPLIFLMKKFGGVKVSVKSYPVLERKKPYIFAATHSFSNDVQATIVSLDRNAYLLTNTTQQILYNRLIYALWLNGFIYIDVFDSKSRKESIMKMERILNSGTSVLIFPEGSWNITENKLVTHLFPGVHTLAVATGCEVVPIASYGAFGSTEAHVKVGEPIKLHAMEREPALELLRDQLATMVYELWEEAAPRVSRSELPEDPRFEWMKKQREEVLTMYWAYDAWDEEYNYFRPPYVTEAEVWDFVHNIEITPSNARFFLPIRNTLEQEKKYDYISFLKRTWDQLGEPTLD
jgi:1-acyl-sn-glycerol-3-phosphate acyltransferase